MSTCDTPDRLQHDESWYREHLEAYWPSLTPAERTANRAALHALGDGLGQRRLGDGGRDGRDDQRGT